MDNILNLQGYSIINQQQTDIDYLFRVEVTPPSACPNEGCTGTYFVRYGGVKEQLYRDLTMHGKRVGIEVVRKRYQCKECGRTFYEILPGMDEKRFMTRRLIEYIEKQSISSNRTFVSIAEDVGVLEKTVRDVFKDYVARLEMEFKFKVPEWLGIDEIHILRSPRCVITNVKECTLIDILRDRNKTTVVKYLYNLPCRQDIKLVCMDMWNPYKDAVKLILPQAQIIADKFHVLRMANQAIETIRKDLREELTKQQRRGLMHDRFILLKRNKDLTAHERILLEAWTKKYPELGEAHALKEKLFEIWSSDIDKRVAREQCKEWVAGIPASIKYAFEPLLIAITNWDNEVFAYFDYKATNAYTEALNSLIRVIDRIGRGYSFDALRAKMLYSAGTHKEEKPKYKRSNFVLEDMEAISFSQFRKVLCESPAVYNIGGQDWKLGVDISTLVQRIEQGGFD